MHNEHTRVSYSWSSKRYIHFIAEILNMCLTEMVLPKFRSDCIAQQRAFFLGRILINFCFQTSENSDEESWFIIYQEALFSQ